MKQKLLWSQLGKMPMKKVKDLGSGVFGSVSLMAEDLDNLENPENPSSIYAVKMVNMLEFDDALVKQALMKGIN